MNDDSDDKERRDVTRTRVSRGAKIIPPRRGSMIHCTVQNITSGGACLKLANTYGLPESFELTFEQGRTRRACRVVWRSHDQVGVAFEGEDAEAVSPPLSPSAPASDVEAAGGAKAPAAAAANGDNKTD